MNVARFIAAAATGSILAVLALRAVEAFLLRYMPDRTKEDQE